MDFLGHPQPPDRCQHGCTVDVNRDPPVWPSTQAGWWRYQSASLTYVGRLRATTVRRREMWTIPCKNWKSSKQQNIKSNGELEAELCNYGRAPCTKKLRGTSVRMSELANFCQCKQLNGQIFYKCAARGFLMLYDSSRLISCSK